MVFTFTYWSLVLSNWSHILRLQMGSTNLKAIYSFGELEWISINLFKKVAVFSLQTLENNLNISLESVEMAY